MTEPGNGEASLSSETATAPDNDLDSGMTTGMEMPTTAPVPLGMFSHPSALNFSLKVLGVYRNSLFLP